MSPSLASPFAPSAFDPLQLETAPGHATLTFDHAEYDPQTDRLTLTVGPPTAITAELTPEGHIVRTAAPDGYLCGLVVYGLRHRLDRDGELRITLDHERVIRLDLCDVAALLSRAVIRLNTRRFARD